MYNMYTFLGCMQDFFLGGVGAVKSVLHSIKVQYILLGSLEHSLAQHIMVVVFISAYGLT